MKTIIKIFGIIGIVIISSVFTILIYTNFFKEKVKFVEIENKPAAKEIAFVTPIPSSQQPIDLSFAASKAVKAVVHVQTLYNIDQPVTNLWDYFFGYENYEERKRLFRGSGSGVIISNDGYIVTNYHVIEQSENIHVVLNDKRNFKAKLVGQDPTTDLALLKIDADNLSVINYGNSNRVKLGEWVLAVGNPYNLTSTVTAGIISAKARSIGFNREQMSIESFIQTDAAVNPGNSGGALVNTNGDLIGINTAIQSRTGAYSGYSFAIPVNIVKKIVQDLKEFGKVQRAFIGISIQEINAELVEEKKLKEIKGVYINSITENGAAESAGLKIGDIILSINNINVNSIEELLEQISNYRPGDKVDLLIKRNGKLKHYQIVLRNRQGNTSFILENQIDKLGAKFSSISIKTKRNLQIDSGLEVVSLNNGLFKKNGVREGFIITKINNTKVNSEYDIENALITETENDKVNFYGIYPNGRRVYYSININ